MLTKFEKRAMAYILALLMCASMVLVPGTAVFAKEEDSVDEVEILESADGYYYWEREDGTIGISGYEGNEKELVIPSTLDGHTVSWIIWGAFSGNETIEKVVIPDTVTAISYHAFSGCENLKEVTLPSGLKEIGSSAFLRCSSMSSIIVPKTVEKIGANALGYLNIESIWNEEDDTWTYEGEKMPDFTILGYEGSAAQAYAKENDIAFAALAEYNDVNQGDWYYRYVNWAYANGLMKGYENGDFGPADNLTRGQFAIILHRYEGTPDVTEKSTFPDVADGLYYSDAIIWAKGTGVVGGYANGNFGPDDYMTREQLATMMYRYAKYKGYDVDKKTDLTAFPDAGNVTEFAETAMSWAVAKGLITGDNGNLNPQGTANRAVTATIMNRFVEAFGE